jgi:hypothetical protein
MSLRREPERSLGVPHRVGGVDEGVRNLFFIFQKFPKKLGRCLFLLGLSFCHNRDNGVNSPVNHFYPLKRGQSRLSWNWNQQDPPNSSHQPERVHSLCEDMSFAYP